MREVSLISSRGITFVPLLRVLDLDPPTQRRLDSVTITHTCVIELNCTTSVHGNGATATANTTQHSITIKIAQKRTYVRTPGCCMVEILPYRPSAGRKFILLGNLETRSVRGSMHTGKLDHSAEVKYHEWRS